MFLKRQRYIVAAEIQRQKVYPLKFIMIFAIMAAGIMAAGYFYYHISEKHYRTEIENQLAAIADLKVSELTKWRSERMGDAQIIVKNAAFSRLIRRYFKNPRDREAEHQLWEWMGQYPTQGEYDQIRLLDPEGIIRMSFPPDRPSASAAVTRGAAEVMQLGQIVIVDFYRNDHDQRVYLSLLIPIPDASASKRLIGVLALRIDPEKYLYPFILRWPTPSQSAETLLVRREGDDVLYLNELKFQKGTALKRRLSLERTDKPAVEAVLGKTGIVEGLDYRGEMVIADVRGVPDSPWFLVTRINMSEVYSLARAQLWTIIGFVMALLFSAGAGLAFVWRQQSINFYRERHEAAEKLRESSEMIHLLLDSTAEAIYGIDLNVACIFCNSAFLKMFGYESLEQLLGKNMHELTHHTRADGTPYNISDCFICKAYRLGETTHVDGEVFWRADGTSFPAEYWSHPIRKDDKMIGAVVTLINVTERKQAEEEREKLIAELQKAVDQITTLQGILPICSSCKKIRDAHGSWIQVETYVSDHSAAEFSHGFCPECAAKELKKVQDILKKKEQ
jgi:PAS domain S-box-containing protein